MNRAELITLLQIERGLQIATCYITDSITVTREDLENQTLHGRRVFQPGKDYPKPYHYKVPPGLNVVEGDMVVLPVRESELVLGRVHALHSGVPDGLDLSGLRYSLRWIMDVVRTDLHDLAEAEQAAVAKQLQHAEVKQRLADFQKSAGIDLDTINMPMLAAPKGTPDAEELVDAEDAD